jgi:hypothetical protein
MIDQKMEFLILIEHRTETVVLLLPAHVRECCAPALAVVLPAMRLQVNSPGQAFQSDACNPHILQS